MSDDLPPPPLPAPAPAPGPAAAPLPSPRPLGRRLLRAVLLLLVPGVVGLVAAWIYLNGGAAVETDNAYVKADKLPVSAEVSGMIRELLVAENQVVVAGQPLYRLDPAPFAVALARAEARLAQVRIDVAAARAGYLAKQAEISLARTRQAFAQKDQQRQADLVARNFISASKFDDAKLLTDLAGQQIEALELDLRRIAETLGGSADTPVERLPIHRAAMAELEQARLDLARTEVRAPLAGTVSKPPKSGQYVGAGSVSMALVVSGGLWVEANFSETDLTHVRPGQPVEIRVDTYPDQRWKGTVDSLSPATGAEFSVIPAQNATGNWVKIAQRVPVRIRLDESPGQPALRAGLSTVVRIETGQKRRLLGFAL